MSEILKEIKKLRKEVKEVKNILTDETSRKYVQKLIDNVKEEELSKEYLEHWTCDLCGENTHEVEYDYLGNNRNHLGCELKAENESIQEGEQMELFPELVSWIYESPDGGKTITKRKQGEDYTKRILVTDWEAEKENIVRRYN